jgi:hypothetical protein
MGSLGLPEVAFGPIPGAHFDVLKIVMHLAAVTAKQIAVSLSFATFNEAYTVVR